MTLISSGIVGSFIIWIFIKNRFNKRIGGKKVRKKNK
jgi:hypothetical protein